MRNSEALAARIGHHLGRILGAFFLYLVPHFGTYYCVYFYNFQTGKTRTQVVLLSEVTPEMQPYVCRVRYFACLGQLTVLKRVAHFTS